jgi:large subunit ribosomal protein L10
LAISKETKEARVAEYKELLGSSQAIVVTQYRALTMGQMNDLRARLREVDAKFQVTKNTLFQLALSEQGSPTMEDLLVGTTAIGYLADNVPAGVKVILSFADESKALDVKGALMGDRVLTAEEVIALSKLPSREELLAQLAARLQSPIYGLVSVLSGPIRGLVYALKARQDQLAETAA